MTFLKRKKSKVKIDEIYVATTTIVSSCDYGDGCPRYITWYFLVRLKNNKYYELFAGKRLEKEEDNYKDGIDFKTWDTPYIEKVESLNNYIKDDSLKKIDIQSLFSFITNMNVTNCLDTFDCKNDKN